MVMVNVEYTIAAIFKWICGRADWLGPKVGGCLVFILHSIGVASYGELGHVPPSTSS